MNVYHKYFPAQNLVRAFVMAIDKRGERVRRFLTSGGMTPFSRRIGACNCGGTVAVVGEHMSIYHVCLKCGRDG